jgi:hypothetical protein
MIQQIENVSYWRHISRTEREHGEGWRRTIEGLLMQYFGYSGQSTGISHQIREIGKIHIASSAAGETREFGQCYWKK